MRTKHKLLLGISVSAFAVFGSFLVFNSNNQAGEKTASLYISPKEGEFFIGKNFTVSLNVDAKSSINTAEATLTFNPEIIEVSGISKDNSIFSLWVKEPVFSNASGTIEFAGGVPNGYEGIGEIFTIVLKPKNVGNADLTFSRASVLANDGEGTEILKEKADGHFIIKATQAISPDFNNDGRINLQDISIALNHWGDSGSSKYNSKYDLNRDGKIDLVDISILLSKVK
ncbi:MAG: dockerin type I domain-containing protein [bacterium]|nr:dockerin type I domain-containing protein [bacterium]